MRSALDPAGHWVFKPSLLVSPLLGSLARHRPFTLALYLHQRKSSRNLHLQYSAKSQFTPHCQSLITARSDHPPVLTCFSAPSWLWTICGPMWLCSHTITMTELWSSCIVWIVPCGVLLAVDFRQPRKIVMLWFELHFGTNLPLGILMI
jgi:hypothetical protein